MRSSIDTPRKDGTNQLDAGRGILSTRVKGHGVAPLARIRQGCAGRRTAKRFGLDGEDERIDWMEPNLLPANREDGLPPVLAGASTPVARVRVENFGEPAEIGSHATRIPRGRYGVRGVHGTK